MHEALAPEVSSDTVAREHVPPDDDGSYQDLNTGTPMVCPNVLLSPIRFSVPLVVYSDRLS